MKETRMSRVLRKFDELKGRGLISSEERRVVSDFAMDEREKDENNLATFMHNSGRTDS